MKLVVFSHKLVWENPESVTGYATDGGFAFQMAAISKIFDETVIIVPASTQRVKTGEVNIEGHNIKVYPLKNIGGHGLKRKINLIPWLFKNIITFNRLMNAADAVHAPVPSDIGTLGMLLAKIKNKPLFVRYCGNWLIQKTFAEKFWRWFLEKYAGGKNVVLATGLLQEAPSQKNKNIKWIFSTSLTIEEIEKLREHRPIFNREAPRLIIVCRMDESKGAGRVIDALYNLKEEYPGIKLDIIGDGPALGLFKEKVVQLGIKDKVFFHGKLNHEGVLKALKGAQIFCFPTDSEGFPKAVLEALASGLPVFATPVSALPALINPGGGVLLKNVLPETLSNELRNLFMHPDKYLEMQEHAFETARAFTLEKWTESIKQHLHQAWNLQNQIH